ncbi:MAG: AAA family ATPase [Bacteroidia bacterium]|nr:AAA family ATPase [Bacteroidia bacterium]
MEALSLLSRHGQIKDIIRFDKPFQLFYDNDDSKPLKIFTNLIATFIGQRANSNSYDWYTGDIDFMELLYENYIKKSGDKFLSQYNESKNGLDIVNYPFTGSQLAFDGSLNLTRDTHTIKTVIKKYVFNERLKSFENSFSSFLNTPDGDNLLTILTKSKKLRSEIASFFDEYGLEFLIDQKENIFEIQKRVDGISYKYEYKFIADTLRRIIFYLSAIKSNKDSVLLFEEPEAHSFPPYINRIAREMIDSESNQFFIATHSPYLLSTLVEHCDYKDCAVFVAKYKDYQTEVKELTKKQIGEMLNYGTDVFINYEAFVD